MKSVPLPRIFATAIGGLKLKICALVVTFIVLLLQVPVWAAAKPQLSSQAASSKVTQDELYVVAIVAGQSAPSLSFVNPDPSKQPIALQLKSGTEGLTASVPIVVQNNSTYAGPLEVELLILTANYSADAQTPFTMPTSIKLGPKAEFPRDYPLLFTSLPSLPSVSALGGANFPLIIGLGKDSQLSSLDGLLVVRGDGSGPVQGASLRVTIYATDPATRLTWSDVVFEGTDTTVTAECLLPLCLGHWARFGETPVRLRATGPASGDPSASAKKLIANADTIKGNAITSVYLTGPNRHAIVTLTKPLVEDSDGWVRTTARASEVTSPGQYKGDLSLGAPSAPGDSTKPPRLAVTLKVQDLFVWPFLALLLGTVIAWGFLRRTHETRPKEVLARELEIARSNYQAEKKKTDNATCPYTLDHLFQSTNIWRCSDGVAAGNEVQAQESKAEQVYCEAMRADTEEAFDEAKLKALDIIEIGTLWPKMCHGAKALRAALSKLPEAYEKAPIAEESGKVLTVADPKDLDAAATKELVKQLSDQAEAVAKWLEALVWYEKGNALFKRLKKLSVTDSMDADDHDDLYNNDPQAIFDTYLYPATALNDLTSAENRVGGRFQDAHKNLAELSDKYPSKLYGGEELQYEEPQNLVDITSEAEKARSSALALDPVRIKGTIRRHDFFEYVVTLILTLVVYLVARDLTPNYDFTWQYVANYVGLIGVSAVGQVVINWKLLPWFRSMVTSKAPPAAENKVP